MITNQQRPQPSALRSLFIDLMVWLKLALTELAETGASNRIGQFVIKQVDKALWTIEKSTQWSQPPSSHKKDDNTPAQQELTRPLPWVLFLPTLLALRFSREALSVGALIMGKEPIRPQAIIKFIQSIRRSIRAIKYQGIRNIRAKNLELLNRQKQIDNASIFFRWFYRLTDRFTSVFYFKSVKYSTLEDRKLVRKSEGDTANSNRKSVDSLEDNVAILKEFVSKMDEYIESDSDDSDFSLEDEKTDANSETSCTSDDEGVETEIVEGELDNLSAEPTAGTSENNTVTVDEAEKKTPDSESTENNTEVTETKPSSETEQSKTAPITNGVTGSETSKTSPLTTDSKSENNTTTTTSTTLNGTVPESSSTETTKL